MPALLRLDSSYSPDGLSRRLTAVFADAWRARGAAHTVVTHDLHAEPVPHLEHSAQHWGLGREGVSADADAAHRAVLDELSAADVVLVGAPMYNYSLPSTLKAWIDHIHIPGVTAQLEPRPLAGRRAVIVSTRGTGDYDAGASGENWDHVVPPLRLVLGRALGMHLDVVTVSRTLSTSLPALAGERPRFEAEFAAASARLAELAATL